MARVLLATCGRLPDGDEDSELLVAALTRHGVESNWVRWDDEGVDFSQAPLVVLRSTWDYTDRRDQFLAWVDALPRVANPSDVVHWSSDKTYLRDLADAGVPVVPTTVVEAGESWTWQGSGEMVAKPSVGAGSRAVGRFGPDREAEARAHVAQLHDSGRTVLLQPYQDDVDTAGETALIYVDGTYSHAIRKSAMLPPGAVHTATDELYVPESITARTPSDDERRVGEAATAHIRARFGADQLYARIDLLPSATGPVVVELELVEPSLFLTYAPAPDAVDSAADRLAAAIAART